MYCKIFRLNVFNLKRIIEFCLLFFERLTDTFPDSELCFMALSTLIMALTMERGDNIEFIALAFAIFLIFAGAGASILCAMKLADTPEERKKQKQNLFLNNRISSLKKTNKKVSSMAHVKIHHQLL